ncbi:hypothetical protein [Paenibacillus sp. NRS-1760]|uniref:hypothetical protein n=1 Tax=Paenibacillus sp. NRS-1760 TaxID=3233902 RepID=UPI003D26EA3A
MAENMMSMGNIGNMGNVPNPGNMGSMSNMPNAGSSGSMPNMNTMSGMPNAGNMGSMPNMSNMGNMPNVGSMGGMPNMSNMAGMEKPAPVIYEAEAQHTAMVMEVRDRIMNMCGGHMHKYVCVQTIDGHVFEGKLMHIDHCILYLQCTMRDPRAFMNPYNAVLPLVLYELLVITLL